LPSPHPSGKKGKGGGESIAWRGRRKTIPFSISYIGKREGRSNAFLAGESEKRRRASPRFGLVGEGKKGEKGGGGLYCRASVPRGKERISTNAGRGGKKGERKRCLGCFRCIFRTSGKGGGEMVLFCMRKTDEGKRESFSLIFRLNLHKKKGKKGGNRSPFLQLMLAGRKGGKKKGDFPSLPPRS